jgi:hypothetical protein
VHQAEATEQLEHSTSPSKLDVKKSEPDARKSDIQPSYYHYDEKLITTIGDSPVMAKWVKRPDVWVKSR